MIEINTLKDIDKLDGNDGKESLNKAKDALNTLKKMIADEQDIVFDGNEKDEKVKEFNEKIDGIISKYVLILNNYSSNGK